MAILEKEARKREERVVDLTMIMMMMVMRAAWVLRGVGTRTSLLWSPLWKKRLL